VVPRKVNHIHQSLFEANVTIEEVNIALDDMANEKLERIDGIPCEFYKATWDFIGYPILNLYKEVITQ